MAKLAKIKLSDVRLACLVEIREKGELETHALARLLDGNGGVAGYRFSGYGYDRTHAQLEALRRQGLVSRQKLRPGSLFEGTPTLPKVWHWQLTADGTDVLRRALELLQALGDDGDLAILTLWDERNKVLEREFASG